jgi:hypothetical protein
MMTHHTQHNTQNENVCTFTCVRNSFCRTLYYNVKSQIFAVKQPRQMKIDNNEEYSNNVKCLSCGVNKMNDNNR